MSYGELLRAFMPLLCTPLFVSVLSIVFRVIREIARGAYTTDIAEELEKRIDEQIKEEEEKNYIDEDLKKYFNYKE